MQDLHTRLEELDRMETMICFSAEYLTEYDKQRLADIKAEQEEIRSLLHEKD